MIRPYRLAALALTVNVAIIAVATLTPQPGAATSSAICIICGSRGLADFLANVALFMPAGAALALMGQPVRRVALAGVLASLGIEILQLAIVPGRDSSIGDVVSNGTGACLGAVSATLWRRWLRTDAGAFRRVLLATALVAGGMLAGLAMFVPFLPASAYHLQWAPRLGHMETWHGRVLDARLGPVPLNGPPWRASDTDRDRIRQHIPYSPVAVYGLAASPTQGVAPIVSIFDVYRREIMILGADGPDLFFRYRTFAGYMALDPPGIRVPGVFTGVDAGDTMRLELRHELSRTCVKAGGTTSCVRGMTVGDLWKALLIPGSDDQLSQAALDVAWLFALLLPVGMLAATRGTALFSSGLLVLLLVGGPMALGFAPTPLLECAGAAGGLLTGYGAGGLLRRRRAAPTEMA